MADTSGSISSIMGSLITFILGVVALFKFIGVTLKAIDQLVEESDKEIIRQKVVKFWVSTADLSTFEAVGKALKSRYRQMKRNIPMFLRLYWFMLLIMFAVVCHDNHNAKAGDLEKNFMQSIKVDFSVLDNTYYLEAARNYDGFLR
jgi:hypothetical protein